MKRVLITNGENLRSLIFIRAIADKQDIELYVSAERRFAAGFYSKYCKHKLININPKKNELLFINQLVDYIKKYQIDVLIPVNAEEINAVLKHRDLFPKTVTIPFVDYETFVYSKDKWNFFKLIERLKIPSPKTVKINNLKDINNIKLKFPLIVKIRTGAGSKGVQKVKDKQELENSFKNISKKYNLNEETYPLVQEYIENGDYYCAAAFCRKGIVKSVFVYKSLRQYPINHGTSTTKVSVIDNQIEQYVTKILIKLKWHGVAQFDLIKRNGKIYFLEMNPRLYTSLNLTIKSGLNYPYYLCRIDDEINVPKKYRIGVTTRIILSDTLVFIKSIFRKKRYTVKEYFSLFKKNQFFDDLNLSDPLPAIPLFIKFIRGKLL